jgi:TonB family protein
MKHASLMVALALALFLAPTAHAQSAAPLGSLSGVILDAVSQKPIEGAQVTARSASLVGEQSVTTNDAGFFEMTMLAPGTYGLTVSKDGFMTFEPGGLDIKARRTRVKIQLQPGETPPPPTPAAVPEITAPEFDGATMTTPVMLSGPAPEYTTDALERGVEGTMTLRCVITAAGLVKGCKVTKGLPFMNRACIEALEVRRYKPATQAGKPLDVMYTFNIRLKLPSEAREPRR